MANYSKVQGVDFSTGAASIDVSIASLHGGKIEIHADNIKGPVLGIVNVTASGEGDVWKTIKTPVKKIQGIHDLFFVFREKRTFLISTGGNSTGNNYQSRFCKNKILQ